MHRIRVSGMIGSKVLGSADKKVGDIKDLIVDLTSGKVRYALLEFDPGFFKADKLFAVPVTGSIAPAPWATGTGATTAHAAEGSTVDTVRHC